jgi:hypothetical protein
MQYQSLVKLRLELIRKEVGLKKEQNEKDMQTAARQRLETVAHERKVAEEKKVLKEQDTTIQEQVSHFQERCHGGLLAVRGPQSYTSYVAEPDKKIELDKLEPGEQCMFLKRSPGSINPARSTGFIDFCDVGENDDIEELGIVDAAPTKKRVLATIVNPSNSWSDAVEKQAQALGVTKTRRVRALHITFLYIHPSCLHPRYKVTFDMEVKLLKPLCVQIQHGQYEGKNAFLNTDLGGWISALTVFAADTTYEVELRTR